MSIIDERTHECLGGLVERSVTAGVLHRLAASVAARSCCGVATEPSWRVEIIHEVPIGSVPRPDSTAIRTS